MSAKLDDFGDVLTRDDLAKLMDVSVRTLKRIEKVQRDTDIRCLPEEIPGFMHRYRKEAVRHWLKIGAPSYQGRKRRKAA